MVVKIIKCVLLGTPGGIELAEFTELLLNDFVHARPNDLDREKHMFFAMRINNL